MLGAHLTALLFTIASPMPPTPGAPFPDPASVQPTENFGFLRGMGGRAVKSPEVHVVRVVSASPGTENTGLAVQIVIEEPLKGTLAGGAAASSHWGFNSTGWCGTISAEEAARK